MSGMGIVFSTLFVSLIAKQLVSSTTLSGDVLLRNSEVYAIAMLGMVMSCFMNGTIRVGPSLFGRRISMVAIAIVVLSH